MNEFVIFLNSNTAAIFALIGTIAGAGISIVGSLLINDKSLQLRLKEKVIDRRIDAHEKIIHLSKSIRTMVSLGHEDEKGELARYPVIMTSVKGFDEWGTYFYDTISSCSTWLSIDVTRELNLFQDYIINLRELIRFVEEDGLLPEIGLIIRNDFIEFSDKIEKLAYKFFDRDLLKLKFGDLDKWHKYPLEKTKERLQSTALFSNRIKINEIISKSKQSHQTKTVAQ